MRWGLAFLLVVGAGLGLVLFLELRAGSRARDVADVCAAIRPGESGERVIEMARQRELGVMSSATQYLLRSRPEPRISPGVAFCDVRIKDGKVATVEFFRD
jgi:hypothetical protein